MNDRDFRNTRPIAYIVLLLFAVLAVRLWHLQIIKGDQYKLQALDNRLRVEKVPAPRGIIFDRNGVPLVKNAAYFSIALLPEYVGMADIGRLAAFIGEDPAEVRRRIDENGSFKEPIKLRRGLTFEEVAYLEARLADYPELTITVEGIRRYPYGEVGAHLVGYLGKLSPKQADMEEFKDVPRQAFIGQWGVERMFDATLRGTPGERYIEVDALGRQLRVVSEVPPVKGEDVHLSVEMNLMLAAHEALEGRAGAVVAIRPSTGEVLGLLSGPSFDPNVFAQGIKYADWAALMTDEKHPMLNRAVQSQYPPGSTFKIVTALAALESGSINTSKTASCSGGLNTSKWRFGCWKKGGHGTLSMHRAIVESCDVYFYKAGEAAGIDNIARMARQLGLGSAPGLDLVDEKKGLVPDTEWKRRRMNDNWYLGETYNVAIGQGYMLVTPAQLARMVAAVSSGGYPEELSLTEVEGGARVRPLGIDPEDLAFVKDALLGVVNEGGGTGGRARSQVVMIGGKTGTAQVVSQKGKESNEEKFKDHAWFVAFAPEGAPEVAMAVLVEHGGHGGSAAAPVAKAAIEAYMNTFPKPAPPAEEAEATSEAPEGSL